MCNRAFLSAKAMHNLFATHLDTSNCRIRYTDYAVSSQNTNTLARTFRHWLNDKQRIFQHIELNTYTLERAFQRFRELLCILRVGIGGMRIKLGENAVYGIFGQLFRINTIDIEVVYHDAGHHEFLDVFFQFARFIIICRRIAEAKLC